MIVLPESIKFVITDFDGIVTDNCVYIGANGEMSRKLNFKDVMGFSILRKNGYRMGIISGEKNSAIEIISKNPNHCSALIFLSGNSPANFMHIPKNFTLKNHNLAGVSKNVYKVQCKNYVYMNF